MIKPTQSFYSRAIISQPWLSRVLTSECFLQAVRRPWLKAVADTGLSVDEAWQRNLCETAPLVASCGNDHTPSWWSNMPPGRIKLFSPPFSVTGVDLFGPLTLNMKGTSLLRPEVFCSPVQWGEQFTWKLSRIGLPEPSYRTSDVLSPIMDGPTPLFQIKESVLLELKRS